MRFLEDDNLVLTLEIPLLLVMGSEQCTRNENERTHRAGPRALVFCRFQHWESEA